MEAVGRKTEEEKLKEKSKKTNKLLLLNMYCVFWEIRRSSQQLNPTTWYRLGLHRPKQSLLCRHTLKTTQENVLNKLSYTSEAKLAKRGKNRAKNPIWLHVNRTSGNLR